MVGFGQPYQSYDPTREIGEGAYSDSILANGMEKEVC